jgi:acyl carrier protein
MTAEGSAAAETLADTLGELRAILARITSREQATAAAPETSLFGDGIGLDSLTGTLLLVEIQHRFGVDVAAEDLNLDALATLATLAAFVAARLPAGHAGPSPAPG